MCFSTSDMYFYFMCLALKKLWVVDTDMAAGIYGTATENSDLTDFLRLAAAEKNCIWYTVKYALLL